MSPLDCEFAGEGGGVAAYTQDIYTGGEIWLTEYQSVACDFGRCYDASLYVAYGDCQGGHASNKYVEGAVGAGEDEAVTPAVWFELGVGVGLGGVLEHVDYTIVGEGGIGLKPESDGAGDKRTGHRGALHRTPVVITIIAVPSAAH